MLTDIRLTKSPFFPNMILGTDITHAKAIERTGIRDQVKRPDRARSQMRQTIMPTRRVTE